MRRFSPRQLIWAVVILLIVPAVLGGATMRVHATAFAYQAAGQETVVAPTTTVVKSQTRGHGQLSVHASSTGTITEFSLGTNCGNTGNDTGGDGGPNGCDPWGITPGPDGNMWFTNYDGNKIGRFNPTSHVLTLFTLPTNCGFSTHGANYGCAPSNIVTGPDGNLWFTEEHGNAIGRITPTGTITEFPLPNECESPDTESAANERACTPRDITLGPDGALWFTELDGNQLGRITTAGFITEYPLPNSNSGPSGITKGPDKAVWFTEFAGEIGRKAPGATINEFDTPSYFSFPVDITTGSNSSLYYTDPAGNLVGRITTGGLFASFSVPTSNSGIESITKAANGNIWFTESSADQIGRLTPVGDITEFPIPFDVAAAEPQDITLGANNKIWFTEAGTDKIAYITP